MHEMEILNITVGDVISNLAKDYPNNLAVKYTDRDYTRTWNQFNEECETLARSFMALGIGKGDHVAIWATNVPEWILTLFASCKIGAVLVTVNTSYKVYEAEYLLRQCDAKALVLIDGFKDSNYVEIMNELCPELKTLNSPIINDLNSEKLPMLKKVIYAGKEQTPYGMIAFNDLYSIANNVSMQQFYDLANSLSPDDVINMQYTSGTTGFPKGVMLTHKNIINNGKTIGDGMSFTSEDKLCICVPFFHCFGLVLAIMACITHATSMVPIDYYSPIKVLNALQSENCTAVHGVPTMFIAMLEHPEFKSFKFPKLRTGIMAGSPCPIKVMQQVFDEMNMTEIVIVFGQTESSPGCTMTTTSDSIERRVSTVGRAFPGVECKIIDPETGKEVPPNVQGEFCARGYNIMKGYYKMPEATATVIDSEGWLHTGDLATVDEDGYYKITGRIKDMIIRGGENIYPKELEDFLYTHQKVRDVQVIGVPSKQYGEEIMACVILKEGETMTEEEVKQYYLANMARHKCPKYVKFMDSFPMTASGKIQKFKMRDKVVEEMGFDLGGVATTTTA